MAPDINFFLTRSLILYSPLKFLCLGFKLIQIIIFILNTLRECSMHIQNTLRATQRESYWFTKERRILLAYSQLSAFFCYSSDIMEVPNVALCTVKKSRKLLNAHSKYGGAGLFDHRGA